MISTKSKRKESKYSENYRRRRKNVSATTLTPPVML